MTITEVQLTDDVLKTLIALSADWEREDCTCGYRTNDAGFIRGNRVFLAGEDGDVIGYLFGHTETAREETAVCAAGTRYFELEELYVRPQFRNQGVGKSLFRFAEKEAAAQADMIMLSTATKNFRAILNFYIDELGMEFWNARLFKTINHGGDSGHDD